MQNPTAAVLIIGSEILSGRTQDKNLNYIAKSLSDAGIKLVEARVVDDIEDHIVDAVRTLSGNYTYLFTTGGIGGTHDDITAECVAKAFHKKHDFNAEALKLLEDYYGDRINDARRRMAMIPEGATLIPNPVSVAPGFRIENTFVLAGVPAIMQVMVDYIVPMLATGTPIIQETIISQILENDIAKELADIQKNNPDVNIGSYPSFYQGKYNLSLVVRGRDKDKVAKAVDEIKDLTQ